MFQIVLNSFKPAVDFTINFVRTSWYWILAFHILTFALSEYFVSLPQLDPMNSQLLILCKLGEFVTALVYSLFLMLLMPARYKEWRSGSAKQPLGLVIRKYTGFLVLEGLRVFGQVILWTLALIIPGIFKYIRLSLVPFIVILNEEYDKGRLDALKHSNDLVRGYTLGFFVLLLLVTLLDLAYEFTGMIPGIPGTLEVKLILSLLTLPLSLYSYSLLVEVYVKLEEQFLSSAISTQK